MDQSPQSEGSQTAGDSSSAHTEKAALTTAAGANAGQFSSAGAGAGPSASPHPPSVTSFWSASSEYQLGQAASSDPSDRVFPIRSVVSVGLGHAASRTSGEHDYFPRLPDHGSARPVTPRLDTTSEPSPRRVDSMPQLARPSLGSPSDNAPRARRKNTMAGPMSSIQADAARHASAPLALFADTVSVESDVSGDEVLGGPMGDFSFLQSPREEAGNPLMTVRFKHVMIDGGHAVITGRDEELQRCEDEPIHAPGAVQGFGLLIAIREEEDGRFTIRYVSENSDRIIGYTPGQLFGLQSFMDIFTEEQQDNILDHIDFIRDEDADPAANGPEVFSVSVRPPKRRTTKLWCAMHINATHPDLIICEFEMDDDREFPLRPADELSPDIPEDTLQGNPTLEELTESTQMLSKPLRVLRSARKRRGDAGAMQVFDILSQVQEQLASAPNLEVFLKILVGIVKELTGFHRVMIYQFDSTFNGKVVTELVDTTKTRDLYKGLHFPASDIPRQARDLYKLNKVRLLYDRDLETARLVCRSKGDLDLPLDMSHAYLRAMSPIHIKYLANMAVRASMSISISAFNELWGLISCHSYGMRGMRVSFPIRKMCRLVGDTASRNIERLSYASRLQARKLINTAPTDKNPLGYITASSDDLLRLFDADFGTLCIKGETKILGRIEQSHEALAMLEYLRLRKLTSVLTSQDIREDFPELVYPPGFQVIAGLLYVPLSVGGNDFIVFFRRGQAREVKWAGNPYEKLVREGTMAYLEPRKSFKTWYETVIGKCREWSEEQVETAAVLCIVYGKFIEVWRQKEAALQSSRFTRLLLANSAHEVRTPLNAIINYLEIALEGSLDQETRDYLAKSHSASKSLIYVINDLLDLTKIEEGKDLLKDELFDLLQCISEATEPFTAEAKRKGISYEVAEHPGLPRSVIGDNRRVRQAVSNLIANAVKHTSAGSVKVEVYVVEVLERRVRVEFVVQDTGKGMDAVQLDTLFRDLEQVSTDAEEPAVVGSAKEGEDAGDSCTLGLGLAMVARVIRNMDGQLRLKSEAGKGSRFVIQLPFDLPEQSPQAPDDGRSPPHSMGASSSASVSTSLPPPEAGEIMLVDRGSNSAAGLADGAPEHDGAAEASSVASMKSRASKGSKSSDLIHAIQTPLSLGDLPAGAELFAQPSSSGADDPDGPVGIKPVVDARMPLQPVKIPDKYFGLPVAPQVDGASGMLYEQRTEGTAEGKDEDKVQAMSVTSGGTAPESKLHVLIAEDDPINMRVLSKRLEKVGHLVQPAVNGEECATLYKEKSRSFDVVLMDMQMPIVDGLTSTKMIRSLEQSPDHQGLSPLAALNGRVPIFAVSASLLEGKKDLYVDAGFDGWILKPVDFRRLNTLLSGIGDGDVRAQCLYKAGIWERGGWFRSVDESKAGGTSQPLKRSKADEMPVQDLPRG